MLLKNINKKNVLLVLGLLIFLIIILSAFMGRQSFNKHVVYSTGISYSDSFSYFNDPYIYSYNGMAFYRTNVESGENSILFSGMKLPHPQSLTWTQGGAFLTFSESFWLSEVQLEVFNMGEDILSNAYMDYTWYLDFGSGQLELVDRKSPISSSAIHFSDRKNSVYYLSMSGSTDNIALYVYDIENATTNTIIENTDLVDISVVNDCSDNSICVVSRKQGNIEEVGVQEIDLESGEMTERYSINGRLFPTNKPDIFLAADRGEAPEVQSVRGDIEQADLIPAPVFLVNLNHEEPVEIGYESESSNIFGYLSNDDSLYIFDESLANSRGSSITSINYLSGNYDNTDNSLEISELTLQNQDESPLRKTFIRQNNISESNTLLLVNAVSEINLLAVEGTRLILPLVPEPTNILEQLENCSNTDDFEVEYIESANTFRIFFIEDQNYSNKVSDISSCMAENYTDAMYGGYNFYFGARDSLSGRITTD